MINRFAWLLLGGAACGVAPDVSNDAPAEHSAYELGRQATERESEERVGRIGNGRIAGRYLVMLKDAESLTRVDELSRGGARYVFAHAFTGFSADLSEAAAEELRHDPAVLHVEQDSRVYALGTTTQKNVPWGIDRIDQKNGTDDRYHYSTDGSDVTVYVVDSGIHISHQDFAGRAVHGFSAIDDGMGAEDCGSVKHGSHVAGTIGGTIYGVAKNVSLVAVRVLACEGYGSWEGVAAGIEWVIAHARGPSVINMSIGGQPSEVADAATKAAVAAGITVVVAAGNEMQDACNATPARVPDAITVAAINAWDWRALYSNVGPCVDIWAPGSGITSVDGNSETDKIKMSGTSMASPHVAGAAALYLSLHPDASPQEVRDALVSHGSEGQVIWEGGKSPDVLLNVQFMQF